jgi:ABC-type xylose transport system substrate-binding protein
VIIKGSPSDPNADFLRAGQQEVLEAAVKKGDIKIVGDEYTEGWKPEVAQKNMEQILTKNGNKVDAVVAANDGTAGGAVAALTAKGLRGVPVSGQDADFAALNRIALGTQTATIFKDSRELGREAASAAIALSQGKPVEKAAQWNSGPEEDRAVVAPAHAGAGHARQPRRRRQGRLDQEGRALQGRPGRQRTRGLQVSKPSQRERARCKRRPGLRTACPAGP